MRLQALVRSSRRSGPFGPGLVAAVAVTVVAGLTGFLDPMSLLITLGVSATIALVLSIRPVSQHLFRYPETLGLVMACQLLIGRYTGYRLMELFRFRDFVVPPPRDGIKLAA